MKMMVMVMMILTMANDAGRQSWRWQECSPCVVACPSQLHCAILLASHLTYPILLVLSYLAYLTCCSVHCTHCHICLICNMLASEDFSTQISLQCEVSRLKQAEWCVLLFVLWDNKGLHQGCKILLSHTVCNKVHIAPLSNVAGALLSVVAYMHIYMQISICCLLCHTLCNKVLTLHLCQPGCEQ